MKCPTCSNEMILGKYELKGSVMGFLFYGFSQKTLCFISEEYKDKFTLGFNAVKKGYYCDECFTQVILGENG